jgi:hypothetical protein
MKNRICPTDAAPAFEAQMRFVTIPEGWRTRRGTNFQAGDIVKVDHTHAQAGFDLVVVAVEDEAGLLHHTMRPAS